MTDLLLIVPAFNEEASLPKTIQTLKDTGFDYVIVNDGSGDKTGELARMHKAKLIELPFNQGLSGAFLAGMQYAHQKGYSYALQFDADGQHLPEYIAPMLRKMQQGKEDILIGSRFVEKTMPVSLRTIGSILIRVMLRLTTGRQITDPTSGMRMYNRRMIEIFAGRNDLTPEPDTMAYLMRNGARVEEFPVTMQERLAGVSYLTSWSAAKYMIRMAFSILVIQFARSPIKEEEK